MSLFLSVEASLKYLFLLLSSLYPSLLSMTKYKGFKLFFYISKFLNFCIAKAFDSDISNVININTFVRIFIYQNSIWIKTFNINHVLRKVTYAIFNIYFFDTSHL